MGKGFVWKECTEMSIVDKGITTDQFREKMEQIVNLYLWWRKNEVPRCEELFNALVDALLEGRSGKLVASPEMTLQEFCDRVRPSSNLDITTAIIYYRTHHEQLSSITEADIREAYSELERTPPANLLQCLRDLSSSKYNRISYRGGRATIKSDGREFIRNQLEHYEMDMIYDKPEGYE
jgi:hypothetical protein